MTRGELATAIGIWLKVMPKRIWRELEKHNLLALEKRQGPRPEVEKAVAERLAGEFERRGWDVSREARGNMFSGMGAHDHRAEEEDDR